MKKVDGTLSISKILDSSGRVRIRLVSKVSGLVVVDAVANITDYAEATLGLSNVECSLNLFDNYDRVDAIKESDRKRIDVKYADWSGPTDAEVDRALAKHEVNGWKADRSDFKNHHRSLGRDHDSRIESASVGFTRYVRPDGTPILD